MERATRDALASLDRGFGPGCGVSAVRARGLGPLREERVPPGSELLRAQAEGVLACGSELVPDAGLPLETLGPGVAVEVVTEPVGAGHHRVV